MRQARLRAFQSSLDVRGRQDFINLARNETYHAGGLFPGAKDLRVLLATLSSTYTATCVRFTGNILQGTKRLHRLMYVPWS